MSETHPENNWLNSNIHGYFIFQGEYIELALKKKEEICCNDCTWFKWSPVNILIIFLIFLVISKIVYEIRVNWSIRQE